MNTLLEDAEKKKKSLTAEINNGRLAMMAIIGILVAIKHIIPNGLIGGDKIGHHPSLID